MRILHAMGIYRKIGASFLLGAMVCLTMLASSCVGGKKPRGDRSGIEDPFRSYVPARTAVLGCRLWPRLASFPGYRASNIDRASSEAVCKSFDEHIIKSFTGQPYMQGFTPSSVNALLQKSGSELDLGSVDTLWKYRKPECEECIGPSSFYKSKVADRQEWQSWLLSLSKATKGADSVLMPFLFYAYEKTASDRGLTLARRYGSVVLLLVDSNSGHLIWSGYRDGEVIKQLGVGKEGQAQVGEYPAWSELSARLLIEPLWREYPGRLSP